MSDTALIEDMVSYYQEATKVLAKLVLRHYDIGDGLESKPRFSAFEKAFHTTDNHEAVEPEFDRLFPDFPIYYRRSALHKAIGAVDAYKKAVEKWKEEGCKTKEPTLTIDRDYMPALYKDNVYRWDESAGMLTIDIKVRENGEWRYHNFFLRETDLMYIARNCDLGSAKSPVIRRCGRHFEIALMFQEKVDLPDTPAKRICAIDIGINYPAVCIIMDSDGRIIAQRFIRAGVKEDRLNRIINTIRAQHRKGNKKLKRLWRYEDHYNTALAIYTAHEAVMFALEYGAECIVLENLDSLKGKIKGRTRRARLHLWRKKEVIRRTQELAHRFGMRYETVNPYNTSALAYDGSGRIKRDPNDATKATFKNGKNVPADLNGAINIGSRFFVRQIVNDMDKRLEIHKKDRKKVKEAKAAIAARLAAIPGYSARTQCTRKTLLDSLDELKDAKREYPELFPECIGADA